MDAFAARLGGNDAVMQQVFEIFQKQYGHNPALIKALVEQGDVQAVFQTAHAMKGAFANMCATEDALAAENVEKPARAGQMPDAESVDILVRSVESVAEQISSQKS